MRDRLLLPNLNTVRLIAALLVIVHHVEEIKYHYGLPNLWNNRLIRLSGELGLALFFVLSGFLITYILLTEKKEYKSIDIKKFYVRRMLRIWPLYYALVVIAFFVLPYIPFLRMPGYGLEMIHEKYFQKFFLFILILPNLAMCTYGIVPFSGQAWSIGTEEQFYILWPWIIKYAKHKLTVIVFIIIAYLGIHYFLDLWQDVNKITNIIAKFWSTLWLSSLATGGLFALVAKSEWKKLKRVLFNKYFQAAILIMIFGSVAAGLHSKYLYITIEYYSLLFGILIINLAVNKDRLFSMENAVTSYLGKISYGLYMYHSIAIVVSIVLLRHFNIYNNILIYIFSIGITVLISAISYNYFERKFVRMKMNYSRIVTGDNVKAIEN
jgi:peptidoglycan/LPS O-acetylase OafA/YrhL